MQNMINFSCMISCKVPFENRYEEYPDLGVLLLPDNYSKTGDAVRLVISCHGAGGSVDTDDNQVIHQTLTKYLLANGFAIMDMAGLPKEFCEKYGINSLNNIGSPIAVDAYVAGYNKCVKEFNLKKEALIHGASMGGISSTNIVLNGGIPLLAQTGFCPVLDTYNEIYLHPWSNGLPKIALEKIYSLEKGKYDEEKIRPFNPMANPNVDNYPIPVNFWQCVNDNVVSIDITEMFVNRINGHNGQATLHKLPDGGHEPQLYGEFSANPSGIATYHGEKLNITEAVEGVYKVFCEYR